MKALLTCLFLLASPVGGASVLLGFPASISTEKTDKQITVKLKAVKSLSNGKLEISLNTGHAEKLHSFAFPVLDENQVISHALPCPSASCSGVELIFLLTTDQGQIPHYETHD